MKNIICQEKKISRVLITGTGKGAAAATIFTIRNGREILTWKKPNYLSNLELEDIQDDLIQTIDLRCITFGCPNFIRGSDITLIDSEISSRIIHMYSEHQLVPLSLTALTSTFARVGFSVQIKDSRCPFPTNARRADL